MLISGILADTVLMLVCNALSAACLAVCVIGGLGIGMLKNGQSMSASSAEPSFSAVPATQPQDSTETTLTGANAYYGTILNKYATALRDNWDVAQCHAADISPQIIQEGVRDKLGFCLRDLDGNGVEELIVSDGNVIYDLYTVENGEILHLITGFERNSYQLCENGIIKNFGSNSAAESSYTMYRLVGSGLVQEQVVTFDAVQDPENPWFVGFEKTPVSEGEAQAVIDSYPEIRIPSTLFSQGEW